MERQVMQNEELGNFGFLLEYENCDFLFELAELAESSYYVNKRMCTVFIRQLMEAFLDTVIDDHAINVGYQPTIKNKEDAIIDYCQNTRNNEDNILKQIFPMRTDRTPITRITCPYHQGDKLENDENNNKIYIWDFVRLLGNKGSHTKIDRTSKEWLKERYLAAALRELCVRMKSYFADKYLLNDKETFLEDKIPTGSRETLFPVPGNKAIKNHGGNQLPKYTEALCSSVTPMMVGRGHNLKWENYVSRYYLVRRFDMQNVTYNTNLGNFLVHAQKAYMLLQGTKARQWLADYEVLADLRDKSSNYVSSYGFETIPLSLPEAIAHGISPRNFYTIIRDFLQAVESLCEEHIYLRILSPDSIRLCKNQSQEFSLRLIDLETCKLFDNIGQDGRTIYKAVKEADPSLEEISEDADENEYYTWMCKRSGKILVHLLELEKQPLEQSIKYQVQDIAKKLSSGEIDLMQASKAMKENAYA